MGQISFGVSAISHASPNTKSEFSRTATFEDVERTLAKLSKADSNRVGKVCYVYGMGGHAEDTYLQLRLRGGLDIIFYRSIFPRYLRFLKFVMASYEGLVRINDLSILPEIFLTLMDNSMVGVYFVDTRFENELIREAFSTRQRDDLGIKSDPSYASYVVDADNAEASTGIVEIISYGIETPSELIPISE